CCWPPGRYSVKNITVLGATGSIGDSTLDVIARHPDRYRVFALTANTGVDKLALLVERFRPRFAVLRREAAAEQLLAKLGGQAPGTEVLSGEAGLMAVAAHAEVDAVMAGIVGAAGLQPTLAAARAGKQVMLVNKEALVMAGRLFMNAVEQSGAVLL